MYINTHKLLNHISTYMHVIHVFLIAYVRPSATFDERSQMTWNQRAVMQGHPVTLLWNTYCEDTVWAVAELRRRSKAPLRRRCTEPSLSVSGSGSELACEETNHTRSVLEELYKSRMKGSTVVIADDSDDSWKRGRTDSDSKDPTETSLTRDESSPMKRHPLSITSIWVSAREADGG